MSTGRAAVAFVTVALLGWGGAAAQQCVPDPMIVELAMGRYTSRTVPAFRCGEEALVPVRQLADLAELGTKPLAGGGIALLLQPQDRRIILDPSLSVLKTGRGAVTIGAGDRVVQAGDQYLSTRVLAELLETRFSTSWADLSVTLLDADSLPVGRRIRRERAYAAYQAETRRGPDLALGIDRARWDGVVLDYTLFAATQDLLGGSYSTGLGMNLLGGSLEASLASTGPMRDGGVRFDGSWTGVWRDHPWVTQLHLGDALATGPRQRTLRGFSVSNLPYLRPALFGNVPFQGGLGPGWQIEAYRGGRLLAIDSADALGRFSLDVPVEYGENPVDFVAYGPFGEVREFNQQYRVLTDVIPARRFEYGLSFGGCRAVTCTANGNADLRYGLSDRWTIRGGIDQFWRDSLPALSHPYLGLAGGFGNAWGLEVEAVANAVLRGLLRYEPSLGIRLSTEFNQFATGPVQPILTPYGRRTQWTTTAAVQPLHRRDDLWVEGSLDRIADVIGNTTSGRLGVSFYQSQFRLAPALRFTRFTSAAGIAANESFASLNVFSFPFPQLGPILGTVTGRGAWEVDHHGETTTMAGYLARPIGSAVNLEVGAGWNRGAGTSLSIYLSTQFPAVRATTSVTVPSRGPATGNQFVQGSLLYDRGNRQVGFAAGPSVERAGVSGRVFLDQNGDGRWQDDEDLLTDVTIIAGYTSVKSDEAGRYRIWDLPAFEPTLVTVDSASLASPLWIPTYGSVSIETAPNRFRSLDIPIVPGGVIEGRLVRASPDGWAPVAGVTLTLVRRGTREVRELVTFSDGGFYLLGVKPGEYELTAEAGVLKRLGLEGESLSFTVPASAEGATVDGLELRLR